MAEIEPISEKTSAAQKTQAHVQAKTAAGETKSSKEAKQDPQTAAPQEERFVDPGRASTKNEINEGLKQAASRVTGEVVPEQKKEEMGLQDPATPAGQDPPNPLGQELPKSPEFNSNVEVTRKQAEEQLKGSPGYDKLSDGQRTRLLDLYSKYPDKMPFKTGALDSYTTLVKDGRLSDGVLNELERIADPNFKLADGIDREELVRQAVKDIAHPEKISQGNKGTCGATSAQIELAVRDPERYLEALGDLSGGSGPTAAQMQLAIRNPIRFLQTLGSLSGQGGNAADIAPGLQRDSDAPIPSDGSGRTITTRIMSSSFMEYANGSWNYVDAKDASIQGDKSRYGLQSDEETKLLGAVLGEKSHTVKEEWKDDIPFFGDYKGRAMDEIQDGVNNGRGVTVLLRWGDGGHYLDVQKVDDHYAYCVNPWGQLDRIPVDQFKDHLWTASITEGSAQAPPPADILDWSRYSTMTIPDGQKK
jgi:hypothetical protein